MRNSLRERYEKRRKERQDILGTGSLLETKEDKKSLIEGKFKDFPLKISLPTYCIFIICFRY